MPVGSVLRRHNHEEEYQDFGTFLFRRNQKKWVKSLSLRPEKAVWEKTTTVANIGTGLAMMGKENGGCGHRYRTSQPGRGAGA